MGKMNELSVILDEIYDCGIKLVQTAELLTDAAQSLSKTVSSLKEFYTEPEVAPSEEFRPAPMKAKKAEPEPTYTKESIRALLASKVNEDDGKYRVQVKELVKKYGNGGSLTDVDPKDYAALAKEVGGLKDA